MKKKVKLIVCGMFLVVLAVYDFNFIYDESFISVLRYNEMEALASGGDVTGNIGKKYQVSVGCGCEAFKCWKHYCCKGSEVSCNSECNNSVIYNGCSTYGRLPADASD